MIETEAFGKKLQFEGNSVHCIEVRLPDGTICLNYIMDTCFKDRSDQECQLINDNCSKIIKKAYSKPAR